MSAPVVKGRAPARLCPGCLAPFSARRIELHEQGLIPAHHVVLPDGGQGGVCPGAGRPPREPGHGRRHVVLV